MRVIFSIFFAVLVFSYSAEGRAQNHWSIAIGNVGYGEGRHGHRHSHPRFSDDTCGKCDYNYYPPRCEDDYRHHRRPRSYDGSPQYLYPRRPVYYPAQYDYPNGW